MAATGRPASPTRPAAAARCAEQGGFMKITAKASAGFSGRTDCYEFDTSCRADGASVEALLHKLDFFGAASACSIGADLPRWEITVDDGPRRHTVTLTEDRVGAATEWQALLAHLRQAGPG
jgi:hypothetical protein